MRSRSCSSASGRGGGHAAGIHDRVGNGQRRPRVFGRDPGQRGLDARRRDGCGHSPIRRTRASANWGVFPAGTCRTQPPRSASMRRMLRQANRIVTTMVLVELFSSLALGAAATALGWQAFSRQHNPLVLGLLGLAEFIPAFVLALPAGHVIDRHDRRMVACARARDKHGGGAGARRRRGRGRHGGVAALRACGRLGGRKRVRRPHARPAARGGRGRARPGPGRCGDDVGGAGGDGGRARPGRDHPDGGRSRAVSVRGRVRRAQPPRSCRCSRPGSALRMSASTSPGSRTCSKASG